MILIHWRQQWLIDKYLAGGLSLKNTRAFENHISRCSDCQNKLEEEQAFYNEISEAGKVLDPAMERLKTQILAYPPLTIPPKENVGQEKSLGVPTYYRWVQGLNVKVAIAILAIILVNGIVWINRISPRMTPLQITRVLGNGIWIQGPGTTDWVLLNTQNPSFNMLPSTKIRTDEYTKFQLQIGNLARVWVDRSALLTLNENPDSAFTLSHGIAFVSVTHFHKKFQVNTPTGNVAVYGTEFFLNIDSTRQTSVSCIQDTVFFETSYSRIALPQGFQIQATPNLPPSSPVPINLDKMIGWQKQMQEFMQSSNTDRDRLRAEFITRANEAFHRKDFKDALEDYRTAASLDPSYYGCYYGAGRAYFALGNYDQATSAYAKAIDLNPEFTVSSYQLAEALLELKKYNLAESILTKLIAKQPDDHANYVVLGEAYLLQGKLDLAKQAFQTSIQYGADTCTVCNPRVHGGLADIARQKKDYSTSELEFNKILKGVPIPGIFYAERALFYIDTNKPALETVAWKNYLLLDPNGPFADIARAHTSQELTQK